MQRWLLRRDNVEMSFSLECGALCRMAELESVHLSIISFRAGDGIHDHILGNKTTNKVLFLIDASWQNITVITTVKVCTPPQTEASFCSPPPIPVHLSWSRGPHPHPLAWETLTSPLISLAHALQKIRDT